ncbi:hypothetical protein I4100191B2_03190 [Clostridiales bacterium]
MEYQAAQITCIGSTNRALNYFNVPVTNAFVEALNHIAQSFFQSEEYEFEVL